MCVSLSKSKEQLSMSAHHLDKDFFLLCTKMGIYVNTTEIKFELEIQVKY